MSGLRDALVALDSEMKFAQELCEKVGTQDIAVSYLDNWRTRIAAYLSAHPAVEGDAVTVACEAHAAADHAWTDAMCRPEEPRPTFAMRAALDAAWPGMVADAGGLDWLAREWAKNGTVSFDRYHPPGTEGCRLFTCTTQHVRGLGFRKTLDAAIAISIGPVETFDAMEASRG